MLAVPVRLTILPSRAMDVLARGGRTRPLPPMGPTAQSKSVSSGCEGERQERTFLSVERGNETDLTELDPQVGGGRNDCVRLENDRVAIVAWEVWRIDRDSGEVIERQEGDDFGQAGETVLACEGGEVQHATHLTFSKMAPRAVTRTLSLVSVHSNLRESVEISEAAGVGMVEMLTRGSTE